MKIQIVKRGSFTSKASGPCPFFVDYPPDGVDVRTPADKA